MNVEKVQFNQTNFGTKVYIEKETKNLILKSPAKRKFLNHINKLENNGINDVFVIDKEVDNFLIPMTYLRGTVYEKRKNGIFKTPYGYTDTIEIRTLDTARDVIKKQYANILQLYNDAKYNCIMRRINKSAYNEYLSKLVKINDK